MTTLSLCMIVINEEDVLVRCLKSANGIFDEIIIVDTGSTDATKSIALSFTPKVHSFLWIDDFAAARNFAFSKASCEYIMWLDADDVIPSEAKERLLQLKANFPKNISTVMMKYDVAFDESGSATLSYYRERIMKNCPLAKWEGAVHEVVTPFGEILYFDSAIAHRKEKPAPSGRNLKIYESRIKQGAAFSPRDRFYYSRELYYNARYADAIREIEVFLRSGEGWIENNIDACRILSYCHSAKNDNASALLALMRTFEYDTPRAETCCDIGKHFFISEKFVQAIYWYERALDCKRDDNSLAFIRPECYGYVPAIQLCVCHWKMGNRDTAIAANELAGTFKPGDAAVRANRMFFGQ